MKYSPNNWQYKSLEILENDVWDDLKEFPTGLVERCYKLRKKPLNEFTNEDIRTMIGQQIGLPYLIPLAIEILKKDLLAEGDLYRGAVLESVVKVDVLFWKQNTQLWTQLNDLIERKRGMINQNGISLKKFNTALIT